ncbi:uncharacterized protein LOC111104710 isoform X3 [Crassostrea virginica]
MTLRYWVFSIFFCLLGCTGKLTVQADICLSKDGSRSREYNTETHLCCGGVVQERFNSKREERGCCGDLQLFNRLEEICCKPDIVRDRYIQSGENRGKEQICCGKEIFHVDANATTRGCCGNHFSKEDGCCNQTTPFNSTTSYCVKDHVVPLGYDICNEKQYDTRKQICCADLVLHNSSSHWNTTRCCGTDIYDKRKKQCCMGKIQPRGSGHCCGKDLYNIGNELCCRNKIFHSDGSLQCCGGSTYNVSHQECCQGNGASKAIPKEAEMLCCRGVVHNINNVPNSRCCGNQTYSPLTNLCCNNDVIIKKDSTNHTICCGREAISFHSCERDSGNFCGREAFHIKRDLCCNNKLHKNAKKRGKRCCLPGTDKFDPRSEICAFGMVKTIAVTNNRPSSPIPGPQRRELRPTQIATGICSICSDAWTNRDVRRRILDKSLDICRENGYLLTVKHFEVSEIANKTWINVSTRRNIFKTVATKTDITLELPCKCSSLKKQSRKRILLLTDLKFQNPPKSFHLGDSDAIVPRRKKILNMIRERFRNCDNYIVRNIHKIMFGDRIRKIISESKNKA